MGAFAVRHLRGRRAIDAVFAPNLLHDEGSDYVLRRMFPVGGGFAPARDDWKLCIGGATCLTAAATPNGTLAVPFPYDRQTTFAAITSVYANEGGAYGAVHAGILGYVRQSATFAVIDQGRSAIVRTEEREFANATPWAPLGSYGPDEFKPPDWQGYVWEPLHGYPWRKPTWKDNYFGSSGEAGAWSDMLTGNPASAATFSVGVAFVVSLSPAPILLCSARFTGCLVIRPGDALWVRYAGRVRPGTSSAGAVTTGALARLLAKRAWGNDPAAAPSNYRAALAANPAGSLDDTTTWADIEELTAAANPGYAQAPLTNWTKEAQPYEVVAQCGGFQNTGTQPWQPARWLCVVADFASGPVLCWLEPINPPVTLPAGDRITFPDGVRFSLRDSHA